MSNDENKLLKELSNLVDSKMQYSSLSNKIDFSKYEKKEKKIVKLTPKHIFSFATIIVVLMILIILINPNNVFYKPSDKINFEDYPNLVYPPYEGFIKDSFEEDIDEDPTLEDYGPLPENPIIDGYINKDSYYSSDEQNPSSKPEDLPVRLPDYVRDFEYIYEVEYLNDVGLPYIAVYIEKELANQIYEENKLVIDAPSADPLDNVNGSIVDWFYSKSYYDSDKVLWFGYAESDQIYASIKDYVCVGVYQPQKRIIVREIFSNILVNIVDKVYTKLHFTNDGQECLTPNVDKAPNKVTWYASSYIIDETNKGLLFDYCYASEFNCTIDREANTIRLETFAVQKIEEFEKNYFTLLKDYYIFSNSVIVENEYPDKEFGESSYITYNYKDLIEILQNLSKNK